MFLGLVGVVLAHGAPRGYAMCPPCVLPVDPLDRSIQLWLRLAIQQLILLADSMVKGKAFKCGVCGRSFKGGADKVNRSNRDRHQREECMPGKKRAKVLRKRVDLSVS